MNTSTIVQKLWNYCNALRDAGPWFRPGSGRVMYDVQLVKVIH